MSVYSAEKTSGVPFMASLGLDQDDDRLGHYAVVSHCFGRGGRLHDGIQRVHVRHVHHQSHPLRVLRIEERPDVGDAERSKQLLPLR